MSCAIAVGDHHLLDWPGEDPLKSISGRAAIDEAEPPFAWGARVGIELNR
jgi:hypothetical protein